MVTIALQVQDAAGQWSTINVRRVRRGDAHKARAELAVVRDGWEASGYFAGTAMRIVSADPPDFIDRLARAFDGLDAAPSLPIAANA